MKKRTMKTMDGNTAAAHVAYAFTEVAAIYPITPSSVMAECVDKWSATGRKNIFGQTVHVAEMQSEGGAAGAVHGALTAGALTTTFTASQGLLLMIPNMYKIAGSHLPGVIHVSARALATHALSIFGDHSDVMACRQTGYAMLCSNNPQEVMDLAAVAHLASLKGEMPFLHFFDGFRTSHEIRKVAAWDYNDLNDLLDPALVKRFRDKALNPEHPVLRGSAQNPDIFFQSREASNSYYDALPDIVQETMDQINKAIGSDYHLFDYYGAKDAETVMVAMGSVCDAAEEVIDYLNAKGEKVGIVKVRLYRPFSIHHFLDQIPGTCKNIVVLDRCKEPGAPGEPLYLDVVRAVAGTALASARIVGGRYGLGSKDTTPGGILAALRNAQAKEPVQGFTINIVDDVTNLSLPIEEEPDVAAKDTIACKFWGLGADGTVGANKNSVKIIGDHTDQNVQAYFQYDSKKSGGVTISHLRFGKAPIRSTYYVSQADFVACHCPAYMEKYDIVQDIKPGGTFLLNCDWDTEELTRHIPAAARQYLAKNNIKFYTCDAIKLAREIGLGGRTNMVLQAAFFKLSGVIPIDDAVKYMKDAVAQSYGHKGETIVDMNCRAIDAGLSAVHEVQIPSDWANAAGEKEEVKVEAENPALAAYVEKVMVPTNAMRGDDIPVSVLKETCPGGTLPQGTAQFERRGIAVEVPEWIPKNCIQCNRCVMACPHGVLRANAVNAEELANAPEGMKTTATMAGKGAEGCKFAITTSVVDCTGCGVCQQVCPAKNKALVMKPYAEQMEEQKYFDYAVKNVSDKHLRYPENQTKETQFHRPLLEFSGACAGCGETPYAKLVTQMFGDHMYIANATGCSSIWGGSAPSTPYTVGKDGRGPAWENSLFEDNAEFGLGMELAVAQRREKLQSVIAELAQDKAFTEIANRWLAERDEYAQSRELGDKLIEKCEQNSNSELAEQCKYVLDNRDMLTSKSMWIFGGDGWAYDIGYGGLDHVLASGRNVNVLVFDTEVYSNTGGQASKSTPTAATAQFAAAGKPVKKKDLAAIAMAYGYVYVAQVAMGADYEQCVKAFRQAEAYNGPSLIIAYAPCINHGIKAGMSHSMEEMERAVKSGYWHLFRFDPRREGNPFQLDSKEPNESYREFVMGEHRYASLTITFPERAKELIGTAEQEAGNHYLALKKRAEQ